jgi:hypothetical protein
VRREIFIDSFINGILLVRKPVKNLLIILVYEDEDNEEEEEGCIEDEKHENDLDGVEEDDDTMTDFVNEEDDNADDVWMKIGAIDLVAFIS